MSDRQKKIAIIGLGYVGLPLAVEFGKVRPVVGFDINSSRINELNVGFDKTLECPRQQLTEASLLQFSSDEFDLDSCGIYIVTVPTPVDSANRPDLEPLKLASATVGRHLKVGDIVIYESTVFPGATEEVCIPLIEEVSGLKFNQDFFCGYSPERINPGDKINTLTTITKIISGSTDEILDVIDALYSEIIKAGTYRVSSIKTAEASKVIENTQRDLNIAFVNELSVIFERLGIDTTEVLDAAATKWNFLPFRPGMVGGHCIGVDPYYLTYKAEQTGYLPQVVLAGRRMNDNMARYAARNMIKRMSRRGIDVSSASIGVMGITFKENCPDIRNSKVIDMIRELESWGISVTVVDPWADPSEVAGEFGVSLVENIESGSQDALIVAVGHSAYRVLPPEALMEKCLDPSSAVLGDLKALFNKEACAEIGFEVFRL